MVFWHKKLLFWAQRGPFLAKNVTNWAKNDPSWAKDGPFWDPHGLKSSGSKRTILGLARAILGSKRIFFIRTRDILWPKWAIRAYKSHFGTEQLIFGPTGTILCPEWAILAPTGPSPVWNWARKPSSILWDIRLVLSRAKRAILGSKRAFILDENCPLVGSRAVQQGQIGPP